ncbi:hypothetical protein MC885_010710 [Smutsia gigantea]|nr:hypothetical protein MC885_010710 [Smutsia gigantea]
MTTSFRTSVAVFALINLHVGALDTFIAAIYEHAVILPDATATPVSQENALLLMNKNIDVLEQAIKQAAAQGAQIIVTPEDALYGWTFTRETIFPYLEDIPDPQVNWIPCQQPHSCLAKNSSIYVLANIGDKKPCNSSDSNCLPDGYYQYNTNVVYDKEGKLVARYHKYHLYSEPQFDVPKKPELVTFNTTFGRFGIFTCFDILFHDPAITLVEDFQVDTILFPTAWMNDLPFLTAIEFHSAWAMGMRVNLLAADTHNVSLKMTGSGIYAPHSPKEYCYNMASGAGRLLLSELDSHPRASRDYPPAVNWSVYARTIKPFPVQKSIFGGLVCTMLKCQTTDRTTCGKPVETALTRFDMFSLSGTFGTNYVFPEVLLTDIHLSPGKFEVLKDGRLVNKNGTSRPILTVSLFGRWYKKDVLSTSGKINKSATTYLSVSTLLMILALQYIVTI